MSDLFNVKLVKMIHLLRGMKGSRAQTSDLNEARRRLKHEGHITKKAPKRPMARVRGRAGERLSGAGQAALLKNPVAAVFKGCEALSDLRAMAQGKVQSGSAKHGLGHAERLSLASVLRGLPGGPEAIHKLLSGCVDYDAGVTDYHIESLDYGPWRCVTAQEYGVCSYEGACPAMKKRGGKSPAAFAYRARPTKPQRGVEWRPPRRGSHPKVAYTKEPLSTAGRGSSSQTNPMGRDPQQWLAEVRDLLGQRKG